MGCLVSGLSGSSGTLNILVSVENVNRCLSNVTQLATARRKRSTLDLDVVVSDFKDAVENGSLILRVNGAGVYVAAIADCDPPACDNGTVANVTGPAPPAEIPFLPSTTTSSTPSTKKSTTTVAVASSTSSTQKPLHSATTVVAVDCVTYLVCLGFFLSLNCM